MPVVDSTTSQQRLQKSKNRKCVKSKENDALLAPVVQRLDNAIQWINRYPADKC